jgi:hypothetical protein
VRTKEGSRRCARGAGRVQTAAAAAESRTDGRTEAGGRGGWGWLGKVEASVFARVLQDIEGRWLGCVRRVYRASEGWPARSGQQERRVVGGGCKEDANGRRLRGGAAAAASRLWNGSRRRRARLRRWCW